jgi:DNA repair exonuclease SbcCD ATPase subunit
VSDEWAAIEQKLQHRSMKRGIRQERSYRKSLCPICGRTISESAYSGLGGNFKKHVASHKGHEDGNPEI